MPRTFRTQYERVEEKNDFLGRRKFIRLGSGREIGFILDAVPKTESALSALGLWLGRAAKLADGDYENERVDHLVERLNQFARAWQHSRAKRVEWEREEQAIAAMLNPAGRTEAEMETAKKKAAARRQRLEQDKRSY